MASTSSLESGGANIPNPPPRSHSRPTQPPPPPPLPSVPPVPPARDSSITISRTAISKYSVSAKQPTEPAHQSATTNCTTNGAAFLSQFESLFKPIEELPPPDISTRSRNYPSQNFQKK